MHRHTEISQVTLKVLLISICLFAFQLIFSMATGSISLLSDTAHVGGDMLAIVIVILAQVLAGFLDKLRGGIEDHRYHNVELVATGINGAILWVAAVVLSLEVASRLSDPPNISGIILIAGIIGILVNLLMLRLLWREREHLTVWSLVIHVLFDFLASFGVIVAGVLILVTGEKLIDPAVSIFIISSIVIWGFVLIWRAVCTYRLQNHAKVT